MDFPGSVMSYLHSSPFSGSFQRRSPSREGHFCGAEVRFLGNLSASLWVSCRKTGSGDLSGCVLENKNLNQGDSDPDSWCRA